MKTWLVQLHCDRGGEGRTGKVEGGRKKLIIKSILIWVLTITTKRAGVVIIDRRESHKESICGPKRTPTSAPAAPSSSIGLVPFKKPKKG